MRLRGDYRAFCKFIGAKLQSNDHQHAKHLRLLNVMYLESV